MQDQHHRPTTGEKNALDASGLRNGPESWVDSHGDCLYRYALLRVRVPELAAELERVVRALHPHIGARVALADGTLLGVHRAKLIDAQAAGTASPATGAEADVEPAGVLARDGRLLLHCTPGVLELIEVQPPGGRAMDASAYLRGHGPVGRR